MIVRKAEPSDLQSIYSFVCALENDTLNFDVFSRIFEVNITNPNYLYCIVEIENKAVGYISLHTQNLLHHCGIVGEIQEFFIDNNYRGKGIGRLLMNEVKQFSQEKNLKSLEVTSNKKRPENIGVYEKLGFNLTHNKFTI